MLIGQISDLRGKAAYTQKQHVLEFDIDESTFLPISPLEDEESSPSSIFETKYKDPEPVRLPEGVTLEDVVIFPRGKFQDGTARVVFSSNGCVEKTLIHIRNERKEAYTLDVNPLSGQVTIHDSYIDQKTQP
jgi:hypothetical protein